MHKPQRGEDAQQASGKSKHLCYMCVDTQAKRAHETHVDNKNLSVAGNCQHPRIFSFQLWMRRELRANQINEEKKIEIIEIKNYNSFLSVPVL